GLAALEIPFDPLAVVSGEDHPLSVDGLRRTGPESVHDGLDASLPFLATERGAVLAGEMEVVFPPEGFQLIEDALSACCGVRRKFGEDHGGADSVLVSAGITDRVAERLLETQDEAR